ncbi:hypothetical protein BU14_0640s0002 [Porphyra umbilicalis]|uniref:Uncharacterized protein n=1 Tax=Porphyra umbilicalis TaxID=2786 RepID=A0A1X6NQY1_PORUM|nr:hypothetical protein BU14_0640s0002 [Porphyra umbilicalis]|eukprot:OSX70896.1 hypothetical protein BU14_0640s0002 [Porphyra umbilicalis]
MAAAAFLPVAPVGATRAGGSVGQRLCRQPRRVGAAPAAARRGRPLVTAGAAKAADDAEAAAEAAKTDTLLEFFADAAECGRVRFVVVSAGAVLESVAELATPPQTFPIPTKGTYITFKTGGGTHEAHVSVRSVASVKLSTEPAKVGGHDLHVMRLLGVGGGPVLSLLVAWAEGEGPGSYTPEAVAAFGRLRAKYGDGFTL